MLGDAPILTLKKNLCRPTKKQVSSFKGVQTGNIVDAMGGMGAMDGKIQLVTNSKQIENSIAGIALTCQCGPADNLATIAAIETSLPGDIIVASTDDFQQTAVAGDLILGIARNRGVEGFITDGSVRDLSGINNIGIPCFSKGVVPNSPAKNGPGKVGTPVVVGGVNVNSGDIIVADTDGVVVIPFLMIDEVMQNLLKIYGAEKEAEKKVKSGAKKLGIIESIYSSGRIIEIE